MPCPRRVRSPSARRRALPRVEALEGRALLSARRAFHVHSTPTGPFAPPFTPSEIRHVYGFDRLPTGLDGRGQTIAIVDAYDDPTIAHDLAVFDRTYGLPAADFVKAVPTTGIPIYNPGWASEIALDVEWAHAIAPGAKILLVEARTPALPDLFAAIDYAVSKGAQQVSLSWGVSDIKGAARDRHFDHPGVTFLAASGDSGAVVGYPATSPYVTAVGGTSLTLDARGNRASEVAWTGSGGGVSMAVSRPSFQSPSLSPGRGQGRVQPDVSFNADPKTGFRVYDSSPGAGASWSQVGGTSAGTPQWAALVALANQGRAGVGKPPLGMGLPFGTNQVLYALTGGTSYTNPNGDFFDIVAGSNGTPATVGYDRATGLGSPVANVLVPDLINS